MTSGGNNINDFPENQLTTFLVFSPLRHTGIYDNSLEGSDGMIFTRLWKCRYGIPSHTVPLRAWIRRLLPAAAAVLSAVSYLHMN